VPQTVDTQRQILRLLCRGRQTVAELAGHAQLTTNAIRAQLKKLHRKGLVQATGARAGRRRPHAEYEITAKGRETFPTAYEPVLRTLVTALIERLSPKQAATLLRDSGARLLAEHVRPTVSGSPRIRAAKVLQTLRAFDAPVEMLEERGRLVIRLCSCPLASLTVLHPDVCRVAADLLGAAVGTEMREVCERGDFPRCGFEMAHSP
jgi:predicted ArsR family transcriptional regulator